MKKLIVFGLLVFLIGINVSSVNVQSSKLKDSFVIVDNIEKAREDIENQGGIITHIFSDKNILIGSFPKRTKSRYITEEYNEKSNVPFEIESEFISWKRMLDYKKTSLEERLLNIPEKDVSFNYNDYIIEKRNKEFLEKLDPISTNVPFGASPTDTSSYFIGDVSVSVIFPESNSNSPNTENWTNAEIQNVKDEIILGLDWWALKEPDAHLTFIYNYEERISTDLEPIEGPGTGSTIGRCFWINDIMLNLGYGPEKPLCKQLVYNYTNDQRDLKDTNWGFTIFVVDSSNDIDGMFIDGSFAFTVGSDSGGGPYMVMTYDNQNFGIANMDAVTAHETGHIFGAQDQYFVSGVSECSCSLTSGYLNKENQNCENSCSLNEPSIMRGGIAPFTNNNLDIYARGQIGWQDTDSDGILDILDTSPSIILTAFYRDFTRLKTISLTGDSIINVFPAINSFYNDISINKISNVQYRVNNDIWVDTASLDGAFNESQEVYGFTTALNCGLNVIETRAINNWGNPTLSGNYGKDTLSVACIPTSEKEFKQL